MTKKPRASQNQTELGESLATLPTGVEFTATGLRLPSDLTEEEWKSTGQALRGLDHALEWAIGDWLNAGEDRGYVARDRYTLALELFPGRKRRTLQNLAYAARSVESSRRREDLGLGHHAEVAALPADHQSRWLQGAAGEKRTVRGVGAQTWIALIRRGWLSVRSRMDRVFWPHRTAPPRRLAAGR